MGETRRRILVTGASGFLGSGIVRALSSKHPNWYIIGLDIKHPREDVASRLETFFQADITDVSTIKPAFVRPPDLVLHTAAIVPDRRLRYSTKQKDWERVKKIIYDGTVNVLSAALEAECKHFVYTSSVTAVIDDLDHDYFHMDETTPTGLATLHYGKAKGMAEAYVLSPEHAAKGLKACALRPCTIIGSEDTQVISLILDLIPKCETCFVVGDGNNIYDWVYIDNAVEAHVLAAENLSSTGTAAGQAIFVTNHEPSYFWDFLTFVWAQFDHHPPLRIYIPVWLAFIAGTILALITMLTGMPSTLDPGSVKDGIRTQYANNDKAIKLLDYHPKVSLSDGVRRACEGYKKQSLTKESSQGFSSVTNKTSATRSSVLGLLLWLRAGNDDLYYFSMGSSRQSSTGQLA